MFLYGRKKSRLRYKEFVLSKHNGDTRTICAPYPQTKAIQEKINEILSSLYTAKSCVHGFVKHRSIVTNAHLHVNKNIVINLDIKDFFSSINFGRIYGTLLAHPYNIDNKVAAFITQACVYRNSLPQGSPASPTLSNMVSYHLDKQMLMLARKYNLAFSRYADDLTFSSNSPCPEGFLRKGETPDDWHGEVIDKIIETGFRVNQGKVRIQNGRMRQVVTGLIVNTKVNVYRNFIDRLRGALHAWERYGYCNANNKFQEMKESRYRNLERYIQGLLAFVKNVKGKNDAVFIKYMLKYCQLAGKEYHTHSSVVETKRSGIFLVYDNANIEIGTAFICKGRKILTCEHVARDACKISSWNDKSILYHVEMGKRSEKYDIAELDMISGNFPWKRHHHFVINEACSDDATDYYSYLGFPNYNGSDPPHIYSGGIVSKSTLKVNGGESVEHFILDQPVVAGASGSPMLNVYDEVIGIVVRGAGSALDINETSRSYAVNIGHYSEL